MRGKMGTEEGKPTEEGDTVFSNFDHVQELSDEDVMKSGLFHQHAAWNFCGYIWYDKEEGVFKEEVWEHQSLVDNMSAATITELVENVNDAHGYD